MQLFVKECAKNSPYIGRKMKIKGFGKLERLYEKASTFRYNHLNLLSITQKCEYNSSLYNFQEILYEYIEN